MNTIDSYLDRYPYDTVILRLSEGGLLAPVYNEMKHKSRVSKWWYGGRRI